MLTNNTAKFNFTYFGSVNEMMGYMTTEKDYDSGRGTSSHKSGDEDYYGDNGWDDAVEKITYGDEKLRKFIDSKMISISEINTLANKIKTTYSLDVVGAVPHVPNAILNIPQNMIKVTRRQVKNKILNIFISISAHCGISQTEIKENAAKCAAAVNLLEQEGYRCNVLSGSFAELDGKTVGYVTKIKSDKEPLNLAMMAYPMASPGMLRRFGLRFFETTPIDFTHSGYGTPMDNHDAIKKILKENLNIDNPFVFSVSKNSGKVEDIANTFKF